MPLMPKRRALKRRTIQIIDDEAGPSLGGPSSVIPFLLGGVLAVGSLLALFYLDTLSGDRTSLIAPPPPPGQVVSAAG